MHEDTNETSLNLSLNHVATPTVLIVDDDHLVLERLQQIVASQDYEVHTASSGREALDLIERLSPSIVITDLMMPTVGGLDLCRHLRARHTRTYVYIMLLTMRDDEKNVLAGLEAGADDYLSKRSSADLFLARLRIARRVLSLEHTLKGALERKRQIAMSDELTGIYNRHYLIRHLSRAIKRAQRFGGNVALLLLDVDHFKPINDSYGHTAGDAVLKQITQRIGLNLKRETDWCARLGGDEFVVVLEGAGLPEARLCAERVREAIAKTPLETPAGALRVTVSVGVAGLERLPQRKQATAQTLIDSADRGLYLSKTHGRNRVTVQADTCVLALARAGSESLTHAKA